jgi:phosphatidylglycerol---prolipoprotein diacylglyceryl transferase
MFSYPNFDPVAIHLGPVHIYWYGIMYVIAFALALLLARYRVAKKGIFKAWDMQQVEDLIFYCALGVIIGGRIGEMFFYEFHTLVQNPFSLFKIWQGGMSFHGGLIGVLLAFYFFAKKNQKTFFAVSDFLVPLAPLGLACGRLGNFINGELWGRVTAVPWAMVFPLAGPELRHPSQLYEFFFEGIVLFLIIWFYSSKKRPRGATSGWFLLFYAVFRFLLEFIREPEIQSGFVAFGWMTMGQLLCVPMFLAAAVILVLAYQKKI